MLPKLSHGLEIHLFLVLESRCLVEENFNKILSVEPNLYTEDQLAGVGLKNMKDCNKAKQRKEVH